MEISEEHGWAKINLCLHITARRDDGYHLLDSLVVFGEMADQLSWRTGTAPLTLRVDGPFADALKASGGGGDGDLVLRAARAFAEVFGPLPGGVLQLTKNLPVASGIGGGSADAAALLRLAARARDVGLQDPELQRLARGLGADVPMCLASQTLRARGIGDELSAGPRLPEGLALLLVNPGLSVSTAAIFSSLQREDLRPAPREAPTDLSDMAALVAWLQECRNDLQQPAISQAPVIAEVLAELGELPGSRFARMSGSGASCFGLFDDLQGAQMAAADLSRRIPQWWVAAGRLRSASGGDNIPTNSNHQQV